MLGVARWFFAVLGGLLIGAGLFLHGQVVFARYLQDEVDHTFVLWRAIGNATFAFQGGDTRMALAMGEVPPAALRESDRAAWMLMIVGGLVALASPLLRRGRSAPPAKPRPRRN